MKPRELLATAQIPGGEELRLFKRDTDFIIALGGNELMSSRQSGSEEALALLTCERLQNTEAPHLLIGGYGMGFTLRAALARLGPQARFTVVELVPEVIEWARGPMAELAAGCLDDPRITLIERDVARVIRNADRSYDAILLDIDNGPDGVTRADNDQIYATYGLLEAKKALKPGGVLAIWSAKTDERFTRRLKHAGFQVEEVMVRAGRNGKGARHVIWFCACAMSRASEERSVAAIQLNASDWEGGFVLPGFAIPPIGKLLGGRFESHDPVAGVLRVSFPTKPEYANPGGAVMGGIVAAFLDDCMGPLVVAATGGERFPVTLDLHTTYFKPVPIGPRALVEARIDRLGVSAVFTSAQVTSDGGDVLVRAVQTAMLRTLAKG